MGELGDFLPFCSVAQPWSRPGVPESQEEVLSSDGAHSSRARRMLWGDHWEVRLDLEYGLR